MGLRTLKESKVRLKRQLSLITDLCDVLRAQLDTWWQQQELSVGAHKTRCPDFSTGALLMVVKALHVAYQQQKSPPGLRHKPEFIWLSLKRTNNVARWYKITRSIMVIIMPFIKIGQLSQHLASIGGSCRWGSWHSLVPYIFSTLLSRPAVSDLTKLNRWWFGPIMFRRTQANGICWLLLSFFPPFSLSSHIDSGEVTASCGSPTCVWLCTEKRMERGKAQRVLSHKPVSAGAGLNRWIQAKAGTKNSVTSPSFMGGI